MQFLNNDDRKKIAYFASLSLLFSYAEAFFPRIIPFFRLGFGNIAILLSLDFSFFPFLILTFIKAICTSLISGTLFSPFILVSVCQSVISGLVMWLIFQLSRRLFSRYGISILGAATSTFIQIFLTSFFAGKGVYKFAGPMLLFSILAGFITAFIANQIKLPSVIPEFEGDAALEKWEISSLLLPTAILLSSVLIFNMNKLSVLTFCLIASLCFQRACGRKIHWGMYFFFFVFMLISNLLTPTGKVLYKIAGFSITEEALKLGLKKGFAFTAVSALSQCAAFIPLKNSLISAKCLKYFSSFLQSFSEKSGPLLQRLNSVLNTPKLNCQKLKSKVYSLWISVIMTAVFICCFIVNLKVKI